MRDYEDFGRQRRVFADVAAQSPGRLLTLRIQTDNDLRAFSAELDQLAATVAAANSAE